MTSYKMSQIRNAILEIRAHKTQPARCTALHALRLYVEMPTEVNYLSLYKIGNKAFTTCADNKSGHMMNTHTAYASDGSSQCESLKSILHHCRHRHRISTPHRTKAAAATSH